MVRNNFGIFVMPWISKSLWATFARPPHLIFKTFDLRSTYMKLKHVSSNNVRLFCWFSSSVRHQIFRGTFSQTIIPSELVAPRVVNNRNSLTKKLNFFVKTREQLWKTKSVLPFKRKGNKIKFPFG